MAKLPTIEDFGRRPTPGVAGPANIPTPNVGGGISAIGRGVLAIADVVDKVQYRDDKLRAEDAYNQLQQKVIDFTSGDEGYERLKAGQVAGKPVYKDYSDKFNRAADDIANSLDNEQQKQFFKSRADVSRLQYGNNLVNHIQREKDIYAKQVLEGGRAIEVQNAGANWDKPGDLALSVKRTQKLIDDQAEHEGWSKDYKKAKELEATSAIHETVISQAVDTDNPEYAKEYFKQNKKQIDATKYAALEKLIKKSDDKVLAQEVTDDIFARGLDEKTALAEVRKKYKGDQENSIVKSVKDRFRETENQQKDGFNQAAREAWTNYANNRDYNKIPLTVLNRMDGKEREALHAYAEREKAGKPTKTNWGMYQYLMDLAKNNPADFQNSDKTVLLKYRPYLSDQDMRKFIDMQANPEKIDYFSTAQQLANRRLLSMGLDPKDVNKDNKDGKAVRNFMDRLDTETARFSSMNGGKKPDDNDLNKIMDDIQKDQATVHHWIFAEEPKPIAAMTTSERENAYTEVKGERIYYKDIDREIRKGITDRLVEANKKLPPSQRIPITEREIVNRYLQGRVK